MGVTIEIVAADLQRALAFYRLLGLDIPDPEGPPRCRRGVR